MNCILNRAVRIPAFATFLALGLIWANSASAQYTLTTLSDPNASGSTVPSGINSAGTIVGSYETGPSTSNNFVDLGGTYDDYAGPAGGSVALNAIDDAGDTVGTDYTSGQSGLSYSGFIQAAGLDTTIAEPAAPTKTVAYAVSSTGVVAGYYYLNDQATGFTYSGGFFNTLNVPGSANTFVTGINSAGEIVGYYNTSGNAFGLQGFVDNAGKFTTVNDPNGIGNTSILGVNDLGQLVGGYTDTSGIVHGFVDTAGSFENVDGPGTIDRTEVVGINNSGTIIGYYEGSSDVETGFVGTTLAVPEPSQGLLCGLAACGTLLALGRRTRPLV